MRIIRRLVVVLFVIFVVIPVCNFVLVHLKAGYNDAERQKASQAATQSAPTAKADRPAPAKVNFAAIDFSKNDVDAQNRSDHFVDSLPSIKGTARDGSTEGLVQQGSFEVLGTISQIDGAVRVRLPSSSHVGGLVHLEVTVESGSIRAYLDGLNDHVVSGNVFVEVTPGQPGRLNGYLEDRSDSGTPEQDFVLESRQGKATGIAYRVYR